MTIYIDIIFIENICMNFIILFSVGYIMKIKIKYIKLLLSSMIGAIYAILIYLNIINLYTNFFMKIILSICMVYIAFTPKGIKGLAKELVLFYLVSFALGGCAFALLYIIKPQEIFEINGVYIGTYPLKVALLGGIVGFTITYIAFKTVKNKFGKNEIIYEVEIEIKETRIKTKMLLDTGNMLRDPITNSPVILAERKILNTMLPDEVIQLLEQKLGGDINEISEEYKRRIRIIPFTSVGKQNGMMYGIKIDEVRILNEIENVPNKDVILCLYNKNFSKSNKYNGLIGMDLLERRKENEYFTNIKK